MAKAGATPAADLSAWLTKQEAAQVLNVAEKTIERKAAAGEIHKAMRKRPGQPPVAVYHPADIERLRVERVAASDPGVFVVPPGPGADGGAGTALARRTPNPLEQLVAAIAQQLQVPAPAADHERPFVPIAERIYLSVPEAAAYAGLPADRIREAIRDGKLRTVPYRRGAKVRREDLLKL